MRIAKVGEREFLFDLASDPRERSNFARKEPSQLDELARVMSWETWNPEMLPVPGPLNAVNVKPHRDAMVGRRRNEL
jgi:hypothetical protein